MSNARGFAALFAPETRDLGYWKERAIIEITEEIARRLDELGCSRAELARRLESSPAYVTKILRGRSNFTLESLVKLSRALDSELLFHLQAEGRLARWLEVDIQRSADTATVPTAAPPLVQEAEWRACPSDFCPRPTAPLVVPSAGAQAPSPAIKEDDHAPFCASA